MAVLLLVVAVPAGAQVTSGGTVTGTVTDKTGAVLPGATVTLTDSATQEKRTATTNSAGLYTFVSVPSGTYDIVISKAGFKNYSVRAQQVKVGLPTTANAALEVGAASQTIEVAATGVELQTTNATIGNTVSGIALQSLPTLGRDVSTFVELQPAVSPDGSVAGAVVDQSTFMLDGGNNTNDMDGSMSIYTPSFAGDPTTGVSNQSNAVAAGPTGVMPTPADSVEEFKVNSALQGSDFSSSAGAQVQVVTKRGTNVWHGTAYEYYLDNNFNANIWQNNFTGLGTPNYHYNRFGAFAGGPILPKMLGGKTYFFAGYEGFRWPSSSTIERGVPSEAMRLGLLTFGGTTYNLNPTAVAYKGVVYPGNAGCNGPCDPRGIGINPLVQQMWNKYMPLSNESSCGLSRCDGNNILGFTANVALPWNDNFAVARLDHDFGPKWHFMSSYRYYHEIRQTTNQIDIGGFFPGDKLGVPTATAPRPQVPWYLVAGMTTEISTNMTNSFVYSYLRNYWAYGTNGGPPQFAGLGGALEPGGESLTQALLPYNVNNQQTRTRFWDGQDNMFKDDVTWLKGRHTFQFGGQYQHNYNYHQRTDNGGGINIYPTYLLGTTSNAGINMKGFVPAGVPSSAWGRDYAMALGIVSSSQVVYTRTGSQLTLNPPLTPAFDQSTIPYWNVYFSDSWRMTPRFTLTYGLGWSLELPPTEKNGKIVEFVDQNDKPISAVQYLGARESAALNGQVYNPPVGFALIGNVAGHPKYPYNPYYGQWSPRLAAAYDLFGDGNSVLRAGYARTYGRLNGVDLVLVPLLGTGLLQAVQCTGPTTNINNLCAGSSGSNPNNAFRVGVDGLTAPLPPAAKNLPQPLYPGINGVSAAAGESLDPNFRPNVVNSWGLTFQHQLSRQISMELGYIGRNIQHEYQAVNVNAVPYMMTLGGQRFDKAYANLVLQYCGGINGLRGSGCAGGMNPNAYKTVTPQPFFEAALKGTGYCDGFANCTSAVAFNEGAANGTGNLDSQAVWNLWGDLDNGGFNFPRSMLQTPIPGNPLGGQGQLTAGVGVNASIGYGNYNALFASLKMSSWKGLTMQSNFTWSRAMGTGAVVQATSQDTMINPFDSRTQYGLQGYDRTLVYNQFIVYQPQWYAGQQGWKGHLLGGWTFAPIFVTGSGLPLTLGTLWAGQAFGEGDGYQFNSFYGNGNSENAVPIGPIPQCKAHYNVAGSQGIGLASAGYGLNCWADPAAVYNNIRQPILGLDTRNGGWGVIRGLGYWNMDLSVKKQFKITERFNTEFQVVFTNFFNHVNFADPGPGSFADTSAPATFGTLPGQFVQATVYPARQMQFGFRFNF
jgi:hypothetical protein